MPSFTDVVNGADASAATIQQVIDALKGTSGKGVPVALTALNDAVNFALAVKNNDSGASKGFIVYNSAGAVLFQADKNGVIASPDGIAGASQIPTLTGTQVLTNKTLTAPTITGPTITGTVAGGAIYTAPHFTSPVVDSGGLTLTSAPLIIGATTSATGAIRLPTNTQIGFRNSTNSGDDAIWMDNSDRLAVTGIALATTATAGGGAAVPGTVAGFIPIQYNGSSLKLCVFNP